MASDRERELQAENDRLKEERRHVDEAWKEQVLTSLRSLRSDIGGVRNDCSNQTKMLERLEKESSGLRKAVSGSLEHPEHGLAMRMDRVEQDSKYHRSLFKIIIGTFSVVVTGTIALIKYLKNP